MHKHVKQFPEYGKMASLVLERIPSKRLGTPEDIANAVVLLASNEASWIYGQILVVDGGLGLI